MEAIFALCFGTRSTAVDTAVQRHGAHSAQDEAAEADLAQLVSIAAAVNRLVELSVASLGSKPVELLARLEASIVEEQAVELAAASHKISSAAAGSDKRSSVLTEVASNAASLITCAATAPRPALLEALRAAEERAAAREVCERAEDICAGKI